MITGFQVMGQARIEPNTEPKITRFYPNPATSQITFSFENGLEKEKTFQIFNFIGKKVFELQSISPKTIVDLSEFYRGLYIFQLRDKNGKVLESGKFQVTK
jgi:hypothetical protein